MKKSPEMGSKGCLKSRRNKIWYTRVMKKIQEDILQSYRCFMLSFGDQTTTHESYVNCRYLRHILGTLSDQYRVIKRGLSSSD